MPSKTKKGYIVPKGTEQETGLTRGKTEKQVMPKRSRDLKEERKIIPAGTQQETGLTLAQTDKPSFQRKARKK